MKVDILCNDGSPLKVIPSDIYDRGVGGAELALLTFAPKLAEAGHQVRVYNNPRKQGMHEGVEFLNINQYAPREDRDVVIAFRSPNPMLPSSKGRKIFWSCDQQTAGNYATDIIPFVDHTVVISQRHYDYFIDRYKWPENKMTVLDLGVRTWEYAQAPIKVPGRMIYCSVPDRGLEILHKMWPEIKRRVPHASLVITADYRLWGVEYAGNEKHVAMWASQPDVGFMGMVSRERLVAEQMEAEIHAFPCTYDELFCIAAAECQVAGAVPVTSNMGALATTNRYGLQVKGNPRNEAWQEAYVNRLVTLFNDLPILGHYLDLCIEGGRTDFDWSTLIVAWEGILCG
jgi:glycosyltransferase involved in cell wall biosynthesis